MANDLGDIRIKLLPTERSNNGRMALKVMKYVQCDCCNYENLTDKDVAQSSVAFAHNKRIYQVDGRPCPIEEVHLSARYLVAIAKRCIPTLDTFLFTTKESAPMMAQFELEDSVWEEIKGKVGDLASIPAFVSPTEDKGVKRLATVVLLGPIYH